MAASLKSRLEALEARALKKAPNSDIQKAIGQVMAALGNIEETSIQSMARRIRAGACNSADRELFGSLPVAALGVLDGMLPEDFILMMAGDLDENGYERNP